MIKCGLNRRLSIFFCDRDRHYCCVYNTINPHATDNDDGSSTFQATLKPFTERIYSCNIDAKPLAALTLQVHIKYRVGSVLQYVGPAPKHVTHLCTPMGVHRYTYWCTPVFDIPSRPPSSCSRSITAIVQRAGRKMAK